MATIPREINMNDCEISCLHYPTTVVVVDDNEAVLQNIQLKIGKTIPCNTFSKPKEALEFLQHTTKKNEILPNIIGIDKRSVDYSHASNLLPLKYSFSKIYEHMYSKNSFSEISVIVVDYTMPGMNGEEFCKKLARPKGNPLKIIMLTGDADEPMAVRLFNERIIDKFLRKDQPNIDEELKKSILTMQDRYFQDLTYPVVRGLLSESDSCIDDPVFIKFFDEICHDIGASSYYLIEPSGSFIFLNNAGTPTWLIIKTLNELGEIAEQIEPHISAQLIDSIAKGEVIPYFGNKEIDFYSDQAVLEKCVHPAKQLKGDKVYCYALLTELPEFPLEKDKIQSFTTYLHGL